MIDAAGKAIVAGVGGSATSVAGFAVAVATVNEYLQAFAFLAAIFSGVCTGIYVIKKIRALK